MAESARRHQHLSDHSLHTSLSFEEQTSLSLDQDLLARKRLLLLSRNGHFPPTTPTSSPDFAFPSYNIAGNSVKQSEKAARAYHLNLDKSITKLAKSSPKRSAMVVRNFDGPAGQVDDPTVGGLRRPPSQPGMETGKKPDDGYSNLQADSGFNQRTLGQYAGQNSPTPTKPAEPLPQMPLKARIDPWGPQYVLRTIDPTTRHSEDVRLRPNPQHVPGSYRSEINPHMSVTPAAATPSVPDLRDTSAPPVHSLNDDNTHHPPEKALDALAKAKKHVKTPSSSALLRSKGLQPSLRELKSQPRTGHDSMRANHDDLPTYSDDSSESPVADHDLPAEYEKPNLLFEDDSALTLSPAGPIEEAEVIVSPLRRSTSTIQPVKSPTEKKSTIVTAPIGSQTSSFGLMIEKKEGSTNAGRYAPSMPGRSSSVAHGTASPSSVHSIVLNAPSQRASIGRQASAPTVQPMTSRRASRTGRTLPRLPEQLSSRTASPLPLAIPIAFPELGDSDEEDHQLHRSVSVPSVKDVEATSEQSDLTNLIEEPQKPHEHSSRSSSRTPWSKNWLRHVLSGQANSPTRPEMANLTARPSRNQYRRHQPLDATADTSSRGDQITNENIDTASVARQQQENVTSFQKIVEDLGELLQEALLIAKEAADKNEFVAAQLPLRKGTHTAVTTPQPVHLLSRSGDNSVEPKDFPLPPSHSVTYSRDEKSDNPLRKSGRPSNASEWVLSPQPFRYALPFVLQQPTSAQLSEREQQNHLSRQVTDRSASDAASVRAIRYFTGKQQAPVIYPRTSSKRLRSEVKDIDLEHVKLSGESGGETNDVALPEPRLPGKLEIEHSLGYPQNRPNAEPGSLQQQDTITSMRGPSASNTAGQARNTAEGQSYSLAGRNHFSIHEPHGFSLSRSHKRAPIARDWSIHRKRFVATSTCISTALLGMLIGIYAGEVPAIQYSLADEHHYVILGNVVFYIGLAIPTALFWPLPLIHGRKPYTLAALGILLPLLFPQALIVGTPRSPTIVGYRFGLLFSRSLAGIAMGFANINFQTTLLDLFGSSLQSGNPHQETVDESDVRRHGGGMGLWLGIWTWCFIGSLGVGFLIGAGVISNLNVEWGFWISIILTAFALVLNVVTPEVRRSPYRRSVTEVRSGSDISRRVARGEIKMHLYSTGPKHWWEEVIAGHVLCIRMLKQPGFFIMSLYQGWIYGQVVMVIILLGALTSKYYYFRPQYVGLCVLAIPIGALLAIPFEKGSIFSRDRVHPPRTDSNTFKERVSWTSHLVRRAVFMIVLPFAGLAYTLSSSGDLRTPFIIPTLFAGLIGFLSNLAIAECNGIIMETYDTSDLQPGMTGRPRRELPEEIRKKRTNFSCFPRVTAAFAIQQTFSFLIAAAATGVGSALERRVGAQTATAVVAGILLILTILLIGILTRFMTVQVVPNQRYGTNVLSGPGGDWKPIIIGHPSGTTRRMNVLELGAMSRWTEIRRRNRLVDIVADGGAQEAMNAQEELGFADPGPSRAARQATNRSV
ncbi:MAG: hypothetical protein MMC33_000265 [Icmadophila ericetorum]|nr:hypothetical protein [Icmadophila ericetorum]